MTEQSRPTEEPQVYCRRLQHTLPVAEHVDCPYCFGGKAKVEGGRHPDFCDYDASKDPINFGFPPDSSRNVQG